MTPTKRAKGERIELAAKAPQYIDQHAVADLLGVPLRTVQYWRESRIGPRYYRFGRAVRYRVDECITWADAQAVA